MILAGKGKICKTISTKKKKKYGNYKQTANNNENTYKLKRNEQVNHIKYHQQQVIIEASGKQNKNGNRCK